MEKTSTSATTAAPRRPTLLVVDDDESVLRTLTADLRRRYSREFRLLSTSSPREAEQMLSTLHQRGDHLALLLSDQRMPELDGVSLLSRSREWFPQAKRVLLTAYSDTDAAIRAINDAQLDHYLLKPWDPPEERLYPVLEGLFEDWRAQHKPGFGGPRLVGFQWSPRTHAIKDFLAANLVPYRFMDVEAEAEAKALVERQGVELSALPLMFFEDGNVLQNPELTQVAEHLRLPSKASESLYDVVIVGAGPAGLAAAVYGASEGLRTLLIDRRAAGGQAGTSSRIENYLGFPSGVSGAELSQRAITQARRLGAEFLAPQQVRGFRLKDSYKLLTLGDGEEISTRALILATGMEYRILEFENAERFSGAGVYYGSAATEAPACRQQEVVVVGGGNSAGQAAMHLAKFACRVYIVIRKPDLSATMSRYLIDQIAATPNIEVVSEHVVGSVDGDHRLRSRRASSSPSRCMSSSATAPRPIGFPKRSGATNAASSSPVAT